MTASCARNVACTHLVGNCCPTDDGAMLECCSYMSARVVIICAVVAIALVLLVLSFLGVFAVQRLFPQALAASRAGWWTAMKTDHVVLGIITSVRKGTETIEYQPFSLTERLMVLGLTFACAWCSVYMKYFYLRAWIQSSALIQELKLDELKEVKLFYDDAMHDRLDSVLCAIAAVPIDFILGKPMVRAILRKDWDSRGSVRGVISNFALLWSGTLTIGAGLHVASQGMLGLQTKPEVVWRVGLKLLSTLFMKLVLVDTVLVTLENFWASLKAQRKLH